MARFFIYSGNGRMRCENHKNPYSDEEIALCRAVGMKVIMNLKEENVIVVEWNRRGRFPKMESSRSFFKDQGMRILHLNDLQKIQKSKKHGINC